MNAQNLKTARILLGLSQQKLADAVGVSKQAISQYEKGAMMPNSTVLINLATALKQKIDFFFREAIINVPKISFRKGRKLPAKKQDTLSQKANIFLQKYMSIEQILGEDKNFVNPIADIKIHSTEDAEQAAEALRKAWDLSVHPIGSVFALLEQQHIKIYEEAIAEPNTEKSIFDGLSLVVDGKMPLIFSNSWEQISIFRRRFTVLHELGHIFLSISPEISGNKIEQICNRFAAALLMPKKIIIDELGKERQQIASIELNSLQNRYGISYSALIYRCLDLGIITKAYYSTLKQSATEIDEKAAAQYHTEEKTYRFVQMVYKAVSLELITVSKAAELLNVDLMEIREKLMPLNA